jgi:FKBP-type peptidyl-prolyl cis-trans isomerase FklB
MRRQSPMVPGLQRKTPAHTYTMKSLLVYCLTFSLVFGVVLAEEKADLKDPKQRLSYSIGADIGTNLKKQGLDLDAKVLAAGLADVYSGNSALSEAEIRQTLTDWQKEFKAKMESKQKEVGGANLKSGEEFMAANGKKEGVNSLPSGLQYKVVKAGSGKSPQAADTVRVHYHGTLIDGTVFDSSVERGEPISFGVREVIPGWTEALQLMKEGDKWQLFIPSKLAYGEAAAGPKIGPNSTLVFEVELLAIEKAN